MDLLLNSFEKMQIFKVSFTLVCLYIFLIYAKRPPLL